MDRFAFPRPFWIALGIAALGFLPGILRANDPVERLKEAITGQRLDLIDKAIPELKSLNQLRRGYFLTSWSVPGAEIDPKLEVLRKKIGDRLTDVVKSAADRANKDQNTDRQIAVARAIAEMAENDRAAVRSATGKFASRFVPLLVRLTQNNDVFVQQCAIDALGKSTPKPADLKFMLKSGLISGELSELGPRRLAAYALTDLVKNAHYFNTNDEMETLALAVNAAVLNLKDDDELIRAYSLQAIHQSAQIFTDPGFLEGVIVPNPNLADDKKPTVNKNINKPLQALQDANPHLVSTLTKDVSAKIRLTALDTLAQIVSARSKIVAKLAGEKAAAEQRPAGDALLKAFDVRDPLGKLLDGGWEVVPALLKADNDVLLRRAAMALLESVAADVEFAVAARNLNADESLKARRRFAERMTPALDDPDRIVRWSAARTVRNLSADLVDAKIIVALGHMLIDPVARDFDISAAAAASLEAVADSPAAPHAIRFLKSAITDREKDVEIREASLRTLVQIGGDAANEAFPEVTSILTDPDVRIRRLAAEALGQLGRPATRAIAEDALAALKNALRDDDAQVRQNAAEAILSITIPR